MLPSLSRVMPQGWLNCPVAVAGPAALADELAVGGKDLQSVVAAVDDDDVAVFLDRETGRAHQLAVAAARFAPFPQEFAAAVEHGDRVLPVIRHVDVVVVIDRDAERPRAIPFAFAVFA